MENTTTQRMEMIVDVKDVSTKSSCIKYIGFGDWFNGKSFMVVQYQSNPTKWYFFVHDTMSVDERFFKYQAEWDEKFSYGRLVSELNPVNGIVNGSTFTYDSVRDTMEQRLGTSEWTVACNPPKFMFAID